MSLLMMVKLWMATRINGAGATDCHSSSFYVYCNAAFACLLTHT